MKKILILVIASLCGSAGLSQIAPDQLHQFISIIKPAVTGSNRYLTAVKEFYSYLNYQTAWIKKENQPALAIFLQDRKLSRELGLNEKDYGYNLPASFLSGSKAVKNAHDSMEVEIRITLAAIRFYTDIAYGNTKPVFRYNGLAQPSFYRSVSSILAEYISGKKLQTLRADLTPALPEIISIEKQIKNIYAVMSDSGFKEIKIGSTKINESNKPLVLKLYQLGILGSGNKTLPDSLLKLALQEAQRTFDLTVDGKLGGKTLAELNTPLSVRLKQLALSLNYYRWLCSMNRQRAVVVVNIPAAYLKVYRNNEIVIGMRMILGKKKTPTPTLASTINEVILYPYWHVPFSIATKELLPAIKRNPGYINSGNYQVLNSSGKILDPYSVDWDAFSTSYFPYTIRQSTGCDNSLGLLKLDFDSPFGVYLHDTPSKLLFTQHKRFYSHGCMRMEKPNELGHLVLKNNQIAIDTLEQKGCLRNQSPITVKADEHMPVIVWYNPTGIDSTGRVVFYEDVYRKFHGRN